MIVSFRNYELIPRYDGKHWNQLKINESTSDMGPWNLIDSQAIAVLAIDPADPEPLYFTTEKATLDVGIGWYRVDLVDEDGNVEQTEPVFNAAPIEIMATLDDVNAHLDGDVIEATADNTDLIQVSAARIVRAYLSRVVDQVTLMSWQTPTTTPDTIREIASMLIAASLYFQLSARTSLIIDNQNFAQRLYDQAIAMLQAIVEGTMVIEGGVGTTPGPSVDDLEAVDFFPVDDTDRAFTLSMIL
jgi:hypothetical protein